MKILYFLFAVLILNSCKTTTDKMVISDNNTMEQKANVDSDCPDGGECSIQVYKNKMLNLQEDGTGAKYVQVVDGDKLVVEYVYAKNIDQRYVDGSYMETIQFEIPKDTKNLNKVDNQLQDVLLLYTKSCFCRGEAGTYLVTKGKLNLKKNDGAISFVLDFVIDKTSYKVSHIAESFKI